MSLPRSVRLLLLVGVLAVLIASLGWWYTTRAPQAEVMNESSGPSGWKTIGYEGVRVEIPVSWERVDRGDCEFQFETWGPPDTTACRPESGVSFYGSATFDPAHRPGIRRTESPGPDESKWGGYVCVDDWCVYAFNDDRDIVEEVLRSTQ